MKLVLLFVVFACVVINIFYFALLGNSSSGGCEIRNSFGVYCPGCGGTRSIQALIQGDWPSVFEYHLLLGLGLLLGAVFLFLNTVYLIKYSRFWLPRLNAYYAYFFLVSVLVFTLLRNTDTNLGRFLAP